MKTTKFLALLLAAAFALSACGGTAQWKTTKTVGGKTTVTGDAETMKQEAAKNEAKAAQDKKVRESAPRSASEPILVHLAQPIVADNLKKSLHADKMYEMLSKEFSSDPTIKLVDKAGADVTVVTNIMAEEKVGINNATKKIGTMMALVLKASINSHWLAEDRYSAEESGNIFANAKITKDYAKKVSDIIKTKPHIPNQAFKNSNRVDKNEALRDAFKSLFKK